MAKSTNRRRNAISQEEWKLIVLMEHDKLLQWLKERYVSKGKGGRPFSKKRDILAEDGDKMA